MGRKYEGETLFGRKYWEDEEGNREYEGETLFGTRYREDEEGNRNYGRETLLGDKYWEDESGDKVYLEKSLLGNTYREDESGNRGEVDGETLFGRQYEGWPDRIDGKDSSHSISGGGCSGGSSYSDYSGLNCGSHGSYDFDPDDNYVGGTISNDRPLDSRNRIGGLVILTGLTLIGGMVLAMGGRVKSIPTSRTIVSSSSAPPYIEPAYIKPTLPKGMVSYMGPVYSHENFIDLNSVSYKEPHYNKKTDGMDFDYKKINLIPYETPDEVNFQQPDTLVFVSNQRVTETDFQRPEKLHYGSAEREIRLRDVSFVLPERNSQERKLEQVANFQTPVFKTNEDNKLISYNALSFKIPEFKNGKNEMIAYGNVRKR